MCLFPRVGHEGASSVLRPVLHCDPRYKTESISQSGCKGSRQSAVKTTDDDLQSHFSYPSQINYYNVNQICSNCSVTCYSTVEGIWISRRINQTLNSSHHFTYHCSTQTSILSWSTPCSSAAAASNGRISPASASATLDRRPADSLAANGIRHSFGTDRIKPPLPTALSMVRMCLLRQSRGCYSTTGRLCTAVSLQQLSVGSIILVSADMPQCFL
jgi:hypothetical protein